MQHRGMLVERIKFLERDVAQLSDEELEAEAKTLGIVE